MLILRQKWQRSGNMDERCFWYGSSVPDVINDMASPMLRENRLLILLSILVVLLGIAAILYLPSSEYSAVGSLVAGVGSLLAVIWFSAALYYQSVQLKEQREQFMAEFGHLREEARRGALTFAKEILREAEERVLKQNPALKSINDLMTAYLPDMELKVILQSKNPVEVNEAAQKWFNTKEGPAMTLMRAIKDAAETYFRATGKTDVDYSREPDEFVYIYGPHLWKLPYFDSYAAVATMLSQMMVTLQPGRKAVLIAAEAALLKGVTGKYVKGEKILEDIQKHRQAGLPVPAIAEDL